MTWQPGASIASLQQRAQFNSYLRHFFAQRFVMEVETPALSCAAVDDANLQPVIYHYKPSSFEKSIKLSKVLQNIFNNSNRLFLIS